MIVGAGFGGLSAATSQAGVPPKITVINKKNHHTFQPLLYQVATAGLSPGEIASPIRLILRRHKNAEVLLGEVVGFDLRRRIVQAAGQVREYEVGYDYLIVAAGASHAFFGHDEWWAIAPGLKTIEDALEIRHGCCLCLKWPSGGRFAGEADVPLNFVVVGASADRCGACRDAGGDLPTCVG